MKRLEWDSGTRAAAEGKDLAAVARRLTDHQLDFWIRRFRELPGYGDLLVLEAERTRRHGEDAAFGPLFKRASDGKAQTQAD